MKEKENSLHTRMKSYERNSRSYLKRHVPVIIRIDGKAFHTFTKHFQKPFDKVLMKSMQSTMKYLCENIQGCVFGYTQSDEITLVLTDYDKITTDAWFGYNVQKMASIAASMATMAFNKYLAENVSEFCSMHTVSEYTPEEEFSLHFDDVKYEEMYGKYNEALDRGAMFDARAFSMPEKEVVNCLIWRQQDAVRNSIQMVGQAYFSHKQLHGKSCDEVCNMLLEKNISWEELSNSCKYGSACYKKDTACGINPKTHEQVTRKKWYLDLSIPNFCKDKQFIEKWL